MGLANFAYSTVATAPSPAASGTSLTLASGGGALMPAVPFNATVWPIGAQPLSSNAEIVTVTAISTDTLTITRAQEGTSARTIVAGDQFAATITKGVLESFQPLSPNLTDLSNRWTPEAATTGASLDFLEASDNGTNKIEVSAPASVAADRVQLLQDKDMTFAGVDDVIIAIHFNFSTFTPADSTTYFWGAQYVLAPTTSALGRVFYIPFDSTIVAYSLSIGYNVGSSENQQIYVRINNTTDVQLGGNYPGNATIFTYGTGLSQNVSAGDYLNMKWVHPAYATNPTGAAGSSIIYLKRR